MMFWFCGACYIVHVFCQNVLVLFSQQFNFLAALAKFRFPCVMHSYKVTRILMTRWLNFPYNYPTQILLNRLQTLCPITWMPIYVRWSNKLINTMSDRYVTKLSRSLILTFTLYKSRFCPRLGWILKSMLRQCQWVIQRNEAQFETNNSVAWICR